VRRKPGSRDEGEWVVRYSRLFPIAAAVILALNLVTLSPSGVNAAQRGGNDQCVAVSGGTVLNETVLDVVADGGTAISDTSGGVGNAAVVSESGDGNDGNNNNRNNNDNNNNNRNNNNNNNNNNRNNNNRNGWTSQSVRSLEVLFQQDTASAGNGGVATASANGGVVSIGDINSGGNAGNAITVGDTVCPGAAPVAAGGGDKGGGNIGGGGPAGGGGRGGQIRALPSTGVGGIEAGTSGSLLLALGALGLAALSLGFRNDRRFSRAGGR
jgi:hypothetical protein